MNDRQINDLVRMALEADELESAAGQGLRLVGIEDEDAPARRAGVVWGARLWIGAAVAAAAAVAGALLLPSVIAPSGAVDSGKAIAVAPVETTHEDSTPVEPVPPIVKHQSLTQVPPSVTHERPDLGGVEQCVVVTIYRDMRQGKHCAQMQNQVWSGNKCDADPAELRGITLGQPCIASVNQTLVVALSGPQRELPKSENDARGLADCILGSPRDCGSEMRCLASAAADCVPAHVSVKLEAVASSR